MWSGCRPARALDRGMGFARGVPSAQPLWSLAAWASRGSRVSKSLRVLMPLPQCGPYEALEGIYPGRARKNLGWASCEIRLQFFIDNGIVNFDYPRIFLLDSERVQPIAINWRKGYVDVLLHFSKREKVLGLKPP